MKSNRYYNTLPCTTGQGHDIKVMEMNGPGMAGQYADSADKLVTLLGSARMLMPLMHL